jgi:hypothetical protein
MDLDIMVIFAILVAALSGFVVLATVLLRISRSSAWEKSQTPSLSESEKPLERDAPDFDAQQCFRDCMRRPGRGTEVSLPSCAEICGLATP